jgi:hypothetical protein
LRVETPWDSVSVARMIMVNKKRCKIYTASAVAKDIVGRDGMQYLDDGFEPLEQFCIALPEFVKLSGLFSEYVKDRIGAVTTIELGS